MALVFISPVDDPDTWREALLARLPDLDFRVGPDEVGDPAEIDLALTWRPQPGALAAFPNLKAILALGAGVDGLLADATLPDVPLCRMVDPALTRGMIDYVLLAVLRHHRGFDLLERQQRARRWGFAMPRMVEDTTVGVMGLGVLGRAVAEAIARHGFTTRGWSRTPKQVAGVTTFAGEAGFDDFLAATDMLVCLLPATRETAGIVDARSLAKLPKGAFVINAARGHHVVDEDLLAAIASGHVAGATLDVFHREPLPPEHPFWAEERILVTPHCAAYSDASSGADYVAENIRRARDGRPLLNVVDRARGY